MGNPPPFVAPENDYRGIADLPPAGEPSLAVVLPVHNRIELLDRTLAGLVAQTHRRFEVIVVDDGSDEDVAAVAARHTDRLTIRVERQEHDGFGAPRARNRGAATTDADVIVFLDADCIPDPDLLRWHAFWHSRASNVVVAGTRVHIDSSQLTPAGIRKGNVDLAQGTDMVPDPAGGVVPDDWRRVFQRRSRRLTLGDAAFRSGLSSNLSVRHRHFDAVGGFSPHFRSWGGEDTELTWRLWNNGMFLIPENRAVVSHQVQLDDHAPGGRESARHGALALMADLVPHPFYRKVPTPFASVPKATWVTSVTSEDEATRVWAETSRATFPDSEIVLIGPDSALGHLASAAAVSRRLTLVDESGGLAAAVRAARGEIIAFLDGRVRIDRRLLERAMTRFDRDPRVSAVRCSYRLTGDRHYRRLDDLLLVDTELGRLGVPVFGAIRRRELLKDPDELATPMVAWAAALGRSRTEFLINDHASIDVSIDAPARIPRPRDLLASGPREIARAGQRALRAARRKVRPEPSSPAEEPQDDRVPISYVGYTGKKNLGDEAMLAAIRTLIPWARIDSGLADPEILMVGGGTLINADRYYLTRVLRNDSPTLERVLLGTGVRSPEFWGITEPMEEWKAFIDSSLYAGVRGPDSAHHLDELGVAASIDIFGDPALALTRPDDVAQVPGRIIVCPVFAAGSLWGGDDGAVFDALAALVRRLRGDAHEVVMMSAFPADDRWLIEIMRQAGEPDLPYVPGYADLDETMRCLASADLVVGERLHASILAAACGTPFVAVEYRPKIRDFARSVGMEEAIVRTDEMGRLVEVVTWALTGHDRISGQLTSAVDAIRRHQIEIIANLHRTLTET